MHPLSRAWLGVAAAAFALVSLPVVHAQNQGPPPANVVTDAARLETIEQRREVTGRLRAHRRALLASQEDGLVLDLRVREGDTVEAGAALARLDDTRRQTALNRAEAELASRVAMVSEWEAELQKSEREFRRYEQAAATVAVQEVDNARRAVEIARARIEGARAAAAAAEADLELARRRLHDMTIRAPFAGRVIAKRVEVGEWVAIGDPIVEIVELDRIEAWLDVPEAVVGRLSRPRAGTAGSADLSAEERPTIQIRVDAAGEIVESSEFQVIPEGDPLSRLFPLRVIFENPGGRIKPGMSVTGLVPTGVSGEALTISKDAVLRDDAGTFVYFDAGGMAMPARVTPLFASGGRVAIRSDALQPGMPVIVEGNERLYPTRPIAPTPRGGQPDASAPPDGAAAQLKPQSSKLELRRSDPDAASTAAVASGPPDI